MGKSKGGGKKPNVFKVAGAKSLKAKSKAKPFAGNLKKINEIVRNNVNKIDKDLVNLRTDMRKKKEDKVAVVASNSNQTGKSKGKNVGPAEIERENEKTLEKLNEMTF